MKASLLISYVCIFFVMACQSQSQGTDAYTRLDVPSFKEKLDTTPNAQILDVRTSGEVSKGYIENAIHIDYYSKDFQTRIQKLDKAKPVFVYCHSGVRSHNTGKLLTKLGFQKIYELKQGFIGWKNYQLKTVK